MNSLYDSKITISCDQTQNYNYSQNLQLTITPALINLIKLTSETWQENFIHDLSSTKRKAYVPYILRNETGHDLHFTSDLLDEKEILLSSFESKELTFENVLNQLKFKLKYYNTSEAVTISKIGTSYRYAFLDQEGLWDKLHRPDSNDYDQVRSNSFPTNLSPIIRFIIEISNYGTAQKLIIVRSGLTIKSYLDKSLLLYSNVSSTVSLDNDFLREEIIKKNNTYSVDLHKTSYLLGVIPENWVDYPGDGLQFWYNLTPEDPNYQSDIQSSSSNLSQDLYGRRTSNTSMTSVSSFQSISSWNSLGSTKAKSSTLNLNTLFRSKSKHKISKKILSIQQTQNLEVTAHLNSKTNFWAKAVIHQENYGRPEEMYTELYKKRLQLYPEMSEHDFLKDLYKIPRCRIVLYPVLVVKNSMPVDLSVILTGKGVPGADNRRVYPLPVNNSSRQITDLIDKYCLTQTKSVYLSLKITNPDFGYPNESTAKSRIALPTTSSQLTNKSFQKYFQKIKILDENNRSLKLIVEINIIDNASIEVEIYCQSMIINDSGLPLLFSKIPSKDKIAAGQFEDNEKSDSTKPLLLSFKQDHNMAITFRLGASMLQDDISILPISDSWCERLLSLNVNSKFWRSVSSAGEKYEFAISVTTEGKSKVVTFKKRYCLVNNSEFSVQFCQPENLISRNLSRTSTGSGSNSKKSSSMLRKTEDTQQIVVPSKQSLFFNFKNKLHAKEDEPYKLHLRISDENQSLITKWSGGFIVDKQNSNYINVKSLSGHIYCLFNIVVKINNNTGVYKVSIKKFDHKISPPYLITNNSQQIISIRHEATIERNKSIIEPSLEVNYCLDEPACVPSNTNIWVEIIGYPGAKRKINFEKEADIFFSSIEYDVNKPKIQISQQKEGTMRKIEFSDQSVSTGRGSEIYYTRHKYGHRGNIGRKNDFFRKLAKRKWTNLKRKLYRGRRPAEIRPYTRRKIKRLKFLSKYQVNRTLKGRNKWTAHSSGSTDSHRVRRTVSLKIEPTRMSRHIRINSLQENHFHAKILSEKYSKLRNSTSLTALSKSKSQIGLSGSRGSGLTRKQSIFLVNQKVEVKKSSKITLNIPKIGISIVGINECTQRLEELTFIGITGVEITHVYNKDSTDSELIFKNIQVDNMLKSVDLSRFVLFVGEIPDKSKRGQTQAQIDEPRSSSSRKGSDRGTANAVQLKLNQLPNSNENMTHFKEANLQIGNIYLNLEEIFILKCLHFMACLNDGNSSYVDNVTSMQKSNKANEHDDEASIQAQNKDHQIENDAYIDAVAPVAPTHQYFEKLKISMQPILLSVITTAEISHELQKIKDDSPLRFMIRIEHATLLLRDFNRENVLESPHNNFLINDLSKHYTDQIMLQAFKLLGNVDFLGNPVGLVSDFTDGLTDLVTKADLQSFLFNSIHGFTNSAGALVGTASNVVSVLHLDSTHNSQRDNIKAKGQQSGKHLNSGFNSLLHGLKGMTTSLVNSTYQGAKNDGVLGVGTGLAKGVAGTVTKPIAGVLDFAGEMVLSVRDTVAVGEKEKIMHIKPMRLPRVTTSMSRALQVYDFDQSLALKIFEKEEKIKVNSILNLGLGGLQSSSSNRIEKEIFYLSKTWKFKFSGSTPTSSSLQTTSSSNINNQNICNFYLTNQKLVMYKVDYNMKHRILYNIPFDSMIKCESESKQGQIAIFTRNLKLGREECFYLFETEDGYCEKLLFLRLRFEGAIHS